MGQTTQIVIRGCFEIQKKEFKLIRGHEVSYGGVREFSYPFVATKAACRFCETLGKSGIANPRFLGPVEHVFTTHLNNYCGRRYTLIKW